MDEEAKKNYIKRLTKVVTACLDTPESGKHGLLIIAHDDTETISLYSVNATEDMLPALVKAAEAIVTQHDTQVTRTIH